MSHFHTGALCGAFLLVAMCASAPSQARHKIHLNGSGFELEHLATQKKKPFDMWVIRLVNAGFDAGFADAVIANLDDYLRYGMNTIVLCLQGGRLDAPYPRVYNADGSLDLGSIVYKNMRRLLDETDKRGMVVFMQLWYQLQDDNVPDDKNVLTATRNAAAWLKATGYKHYVFDIVNEFGHGGFSKRPVFTTLDGALQLIDAVRQGDSSALIGISPGSALMAPEGWLTDARGTRWVESDFIIGHNWVNDPSRSGSYKLVAPQDKTKPYVNNEFWAQTTYERKLLVDPRTGNRTYGHYDNSTAQTYLDEIDKLLGYGGFGNIHNQRQQRVSPGASAPVAAVGPHGTQPETSEGGGEPSNHWLYRALATKQKLGPLPARKHFNDYASGVEQNLGGTWSLSSGRLCQTDAQASPGWVRLVADDGDVEIAVDAGFTTDPGANGSLAIHLGGAQPTHTAYRILVKKDRVTLDQTLGGMNPQTRFVAKGQNDQYRLRLEDRRIKVWVGGRLLFDVPDNTPLIERNILLVTDNATACFDNVRVTPVRFIDFDDGLTGDWTPVNPNAWQVKGAGDRHWEVTTPANDVRRAVLDQRLDDFRLAVNVDLTAAPATVIHFRSADVSQKLGKGYYLTVAGDGTVTLERRGDSGPPATLATGTVTALNPASAAVRLVMDGNRIVAAIGGQTVIDVTDAGERLDRGGLALIAQPGITRFDNLILEVGPSRQPTPRFLPYTGPALPKGFAFEFGDPDGILDLAGFRFLIDTTGGTNFVDVTFLVLPHLGVFGWKFTDDGTALRFDLRGAVPLGSVDWRLRLVVTDHDGNQTFTDLRIQQ